MHKIKEFETIKIEFSKNKMLKNLLKLKMRMCMKLSLSWVGLGCTFDVVRPFLGPGPIGCVPSV